jgi:uncharacterized protein YeaO (DUF488 family)
MPVRVKRAYAPPSRSDGKRYLIDRVWPRGRTREDLRLAGWLKDLAPSDELRRWFGHDPDKFAEFRARYRRELEGHGTELARLRAEARTETVTLVFGARDEKFSNASVLQELLSSSGGRRSRNGPRHPPRR